MSDFWRRATATRSLSPLDTAQKTFERFSSSGRALFYFFTGLLIISVAGLLYTLNSQLLVTIPSHGGSWSEGIIGAPRFINPILAISDADLDLSSLVYSGLLRATPQGNYLPDLASGYTVSSNGETYTVTIKPGATFSDGTPVTADDVMYTVEKAQDPALKSPLEANWSGVTVTEIDPHTVQFTLSTPYAPFIQNLTLGILPKHLWENISDDEFPFSDLNTQPVGSGPFAVTGISRTSSGIPASYTLSAFKNYALGEPYLSTMTFRFYQSESDLVSALQGGTISAVASLSPAALSEIPSAHVLTASLNRVFAVFFNQNQSVVLRDHTVRQALNDAIDRHALISTVLGGYGTPLTGPVPPALLGLPPATSTLSTATDPVSLARQELLAAGWKPGPNGVLQKTTGTGKNATTIPLAFSLATADVPELQAAAQFVSNAWNKMGAQVSVQVYGQGDLSENVIRPRKYEALLFGEVVGSGLDLFAFWDSSQRTDPGLNIAMYANATVDGALSQLRQAQTQTQRLSLYNTVATQLQKDTPAVFLYAPDFVYIVPNDVGGITLGYIGSPSDRFLSVLNWHADTDRVWPMFAQ